MVEIQPTNKHSSLSSTRTARRELVKFGLNLDILLGDELRTSGALRALVIVESLFVGWISTIHRLPSVVFPLFL